MDKVYPEIHAQAKKGAEIFWGDETAVQNTGNYARSYIPKGQTPVLKVQTEKMHINMISAISNHGKFHFMFSADSINAEKLIVFMERLVKDVGRKAYLILDNLHVHHSKIVAQWETAYNE